MSDYRALYFNVAGVLANAIETLDKLSEALKSAQAETEEIFLDGTETSEK